MRSVCIISKAETLDLRRLKADIPSTVRMQYEAMGQTTVELQGKLEDEKTERYVSLCLHRCVCSLCWSTLELHEKRTLLKLRIMSDS